MGPKIDYQGDGLEQRNLNRVGQDFVTLPAASVPIAIGGGVFVGERGGVGAGVGPGSGRLGRGGWRGRKRLGGAARMPATALGILPGLIHLAKGKAGAGGGGELDTEVTALPCPGEPF